MKPVKNTPRCKWFVILHDDWGCINEQAHGWYGFTFKPSGIAPMKLHPDNLCFWQTRAQPCPYLEV